MPGTRGTPSPTSTSWTSRLTRGARAATWLVALGTAACHRAPPPGADAPPEATQELPQQVGSPTLPNELAPGPAPAPVASAAPPAGSAAPPPWTGPYFIATDVSVGVYSEMVIERRTKVGYLRSGGRVPVEPRPVEKDNCTRGWYRLRDGGYVCGNAGTLNASSPEARFAIRKPNWDEVLPYTYARNAKNGTPLYKSVPTVEQMREYEPYLVAKKADERSEASASKSTTTAGEKSTDTKPEEAPLPFSKEAIEAARRGSSQPAALRTPAAPEHADTPDGGGADTDKPWWQREDADKRLHEVKLGELEADSDAVLAKRMVKGFYVAVDREFNWNGRLWYKTTKGLVAPADRFWVTKASEFHGVELDGEKLTLPIGFTYGWQKVRPKFEMDASGALKPAGSLERHAFVALTGKEATIAGKKYVETKDGTWVETKHLRITTPGPPPADLGPNERFIDINLKTQTLVAFEGARAVYATLISSGKENDDKEKDHRTPTGEWRIREKHVATTMDGDGSAAGDLPYSIEDVPFVMYFFKSFAVHGAFWHSNYGTQMSHGCVNLSPLDAKWLFLFTEPHIPEGWHGVWASATHPGSRVSVHE